MAANNLEKLTNLWKWVELGEISEVVSKGTTPTTLGFSFAEAGIPFLRAEDISGGAIDPHSVAFHIDLKTHNSALARSHLEPGDLLITIAGSLGRVGYIPNDAPPLNCNQAVAFIRLRPELVDVKFACFACQHKGVTNSLVDLKKVGTIGNLNLQQIREFRIPLPPLPEQKRIATILEKADRLRRQRRYALELSKTYLQSVFLEMFGDPVTNPMKWDLAELSDVCDEIYRYPTFYGFQYAKRGTPVARIGNILSDGHLSPDLSDYVFIDPDISKRFPRTILELQDILMAVRGDGSTVSRIGIVNSSNLVGANISPNLLLFRAKRGVMNPVYLFHLMISDGGQKLLEMYITRTAKKTITAQDIKQIRIPIPSKSIQEKFAQIVQKFEQLRVQQREAERQAEHLFQTLLHQAFEGEVGFGTGIVHDEVVEDDAQALFGWC